MPEARQSAANQAAFDFLFSRVNFERRSVVPYRAREYKLDRMHDLLARLNNPQQGMPIVHIAGTKGKGSTAAILSEILTTAGYRVGLFSSPHLDRIEERLAINSEPCETDTFVALIDQLRPVVSAMDAEAEERGNGEIGPTYFELTTALALMHFAAAKVDVAVLEVGLGGRLDSTNVCEPVCCAITSISFDHMKQLGNTLAEIAGEKAGIIKSGVPIISGVTEPESRDVIRQIAEQEQAPLHELDRDFTVEYRVADSNKSTAGGHINFRGGPGSQEILDAPLGLLGAHQARNAAVALACIGQLQSDGWQVSEAAIRDGLRTSRCQARIEVVSHEPTIIVDAAHNVASIDALLSVLDESFPAGPRTLIFATTAEKDANGMLKRLLPAFSRVPKFDRVIVTRYLNNPRAVAPKELVDIARSLGRDDVEQCDDPAMAWQAARQQLSPEHLVCVTGSFFIAAEMRRAIAVEAVEPSVTP